LITYVPAWLMDAQLEAERITQPSSTAMRTRLARWAGAARAFGDAAVGLFYPSACAGCGTEIEAKRSPTSRRLICPDCIEQLPLLTGPTCRRCGATVPAISAATFRERCHRCRKVKLWFDESVALGEYTGLLREWILAMKHHHGDVLTLAVADLVWWRYEARLTAMSPDVVVPVASHWRRRWEHGTNSAVLMADRLARRLRVPLASGLLRRNRNTPPQFTLPPSERRGNVRGAFSVNAGYHLNRARVLLVDDVLTTGSTCSEAARTLKHMGAVHVAVVVAGRTLQH
jgi:ComF family protein